jgi:succinate dehydrogenase / fumarate reductase iron-sulfur subunit
MKERVVDRKFDPIVRLGRKIFRRDQLDDPARWAEAHQPSPVPAGAGVGTPDAQSSHAPLPQAAPVGPDGKLPLTELTLDRAAASSPYGDDLEFPLPPENLSYKHE